MEYRRLGRSGLKVSPLCLGTMMFGGRCDAVEAERIVAAAREAGINFIDTAGVYNEDHSEKIIGTARAASPSLSGPSATPPAWRSPSGIWG